MIYFVRPVGQAGPVKIGYAAEPAKRLKTLQTACPWPIEIWRVLDGGRFEEYRFHQRFASSRLHGEWFKYHEDMEWCKSTDEILMSIEESIDRLVQDHACTRENALAAILMSRTKGEAK